MFSKRTPESPVAETHPPPLTSEQFKASPEFKKFKAHIRKLLKVPKAELDHRVRTAREQSPRIDNPSAPGRKRLPK